MTAISRLITLAALCTLTPALADEAAPDEEPSPTLEERCAADDGQACFELAFERRRAQDDTSDAAFVRLLKRACELEASTCGDLGYVYLYATIVERDLDRSVGFFERACGADDRESCMQLAQLFREGLGVEQDQERADRFHAKACADLDEEACRRQFAAQPREPSP